MILVRLGHVLLVLPAYAAASDATCTAIAARQASQQYDSALAHFDHVLKLQPRNAGALFRRGLVYRSLRQYERAADDLETAKKLDPGNPAMRVDYRSMGRRGFWVTHPQVLCMNKCSLVNMRSLKIKAEEHT